MRKPHAEIPEPLLTSIEGAQRMLGLGRSSINNLIATGELEVARIFGRTLPKIASVRRIATQGTLAAPPTHRKAARAP